MRRASVQNMIKTGITVQNVLSTNTTKIPCYSSTPEGIPGELIFNTTSQTFQGNNGSGWSNFSVGGSVSSVGLSMPPEFTVTNSPVTGVGVLAVTANPQAAKQVYAGPSSGAPATPSFRSLTIGDIIPSGIVPPSAGGTGVANGGTLTIGANPITFTTTGPTNLNIPTTGTVATLNGLEALTNKTITSPTNNVTSNKLFFNSNTGSIDISLPGNVPTAGAVLAALNSASARWTPLGSTGSVSMIYVKPSSFGNPPVSQTLSTPTEFFSIVDAINYINGLTPQPTDNNRYIIFIYPGLYSEVSQINVPSFVYLVGECMETVRITPTFVPVSGLGYDFTTFAPNSGASFLTIQGVDPPYVSPANASNAIRCTNSDDYILFHKIEIENCQKGIMCDTTPSGPSGGSYVYLEFTDTNVGANVYSLYCKSDGTPLTVSAENHFTYEYSQDAFIADGSMCELLLSSCSIQSGDGNGNGVTVSNGAILNSQGLYIESFFTAINVVADLGSPNVTMEGLIMENCTNELQILNDNTSGHFTGYTEYIKTFISPLCTFFITNQDSRVVTVAKQGGNFQSVADALAAITTSSSTNRYVIYVGPGVFDEPVLDFTGKQGISIIGYYQTTSTLNYSPITGAEFIIADGDIVFQNLTLQVIPVVTNVNKIISYPGANGKNLRLYNCVFKGGDLLNFYALDTVIDCQATSGAISLLLLNCIFNPAIYFKTGLYFHDPVVYPIDFSINGLLWGRALNATFYPNDYFINIYCISLTPQHISGAINNSLLGSSLTPFTGTGLNIDGSTNTIVQNSVFSGFTTGIAVNGSIAKNITIISTIVQYCTTCANIGPGSTVGVLNIVAERNTVIVDPSILTLAVQINDPITGSISIIGDIYQGDTFANSTNISQQIQKAASVGAIGQIIITGGPGLTVSIPSGAGYVMTALTGGVLKYVTWSAFTITANNDAITWFSISSTGTLIQSLTELSGITEITIGSVRTDGGSITFIQQVTHNLDNLASVIDNTLQTIGPIVGSGLITVSSGSAGAWQLSVSSGSYTYGSETFTPAANGPITMFGYYPNGLVINTTPGLTFVPLQYNLSGTLTNIIGGQWTKHALYLVGDIPTYLLVYGTNLYASQLLAESAPLPSPPNFFLANICPIAGIIIDGPNTSIALQDIRPILGFKSNGTLASADHNSLLNLTLGNAHPQYFLVDGATPMAGPIVMGGNQITGAGLINGVNIALHGSQHGANQTDPIPTAALGDITQIVSTANSPGISNTFSRGDHTHFHGLLSSVNGSNPLHSLATALIPGFMSSAHFTLLNGATSSSTPSTLMLRDINSQTALQSLQFTNGANTLVLSAPGLVGNFQLNLPITVGLNGYFLSTNGSSPTYQTSWTNSLIDNVIVISKNGFPNRTINFDVANTVNSQLTLRSIVTSNQTLTFPDATDTLVGLATIDTLTNKTLTSPVINGSITGTLVLDILHGGTGTNIAPANGNLLIGNGGSWNVASLTAGANITITPGPGSITISGFGGTLTTISIATANGLAGTVLNPTTTPVITLSTTVGSPLVPQLLIGNGTAISGITGNNGTVITSGTGVPSISSTLPTAVQGNITTVGTITSGVWNGTTITASNGGTGLNSFNIGDLLYANTISSFGKLLAVASGNALISNGTNTAPSYGKIGLTTHVSGVLPIANGGTNSNVALNNNSIIVSSGGSLVEASALTNGQLLIGSTGAAPVAGTITAGVGISVTNTAGSITIANVGGTITTISIASTNGLAGTVLNPTTTPVVTLSTTIGSPLVPQLLIGNGTAISGITGNNGTLITSGTGVPSISSTLPTAVQGNITTVGTITSGVWNGTTIAASNGGTGLNSFNIGDLLYANTISSFGKLLAVATGNALISNGINTAPSYGKIGLTTHVSGILPIANGGTGISSAPVNGNLLIGNGGSWTAASLTAGTNISITPGAGSITISNTGGTVTNLSVVSANGLSGTVATSTTTPAITLTTTVGSPVVPQLLVGNGTSIIGITGNNGTLITSGTGVPSISSTLPTAVQGNITSLGTITSGVWNGTTIAIANGGTGTTTAPVNGSLLIGNAGSWNVASLTAGANISITPGAGSITITGTGSVSNVSIVSANGFSGTVATSTTTPAITLTTTIGTALVPQVLTGNGTSIIGITGNNGTLITSGTGVPSISSTLPTAVQGNITSLGTITSGVWNGTTIAIANGGTGTTTAPVNGSLLIGNAGSWSVASLTAGTNISITPGAGTITIAATGGSGTVTDVSIVNTNGFSGTVATSTTTPAITLTTTIGTALVPQVLTGNGTAISGITGNNGTLITSGTGVPSISSTLPTAVQGNITSLGTITSGVWNGTTIAIANGGTGTTTAPVNGSLLIGNAGSWNVANLTAGTGISITNTAGAITIANAYVASVLTNTVAIANTETVIVSYSATANELALGTTFNFEAFTTQAGNNAAAPIVRIRVGPTTLTGNIAATLTGSPGSGATVSSTYRGSVTIRTAGAGTVNGSIMGIRQGVAAIVTPTLVPVAVDTTVANLIELTFISGNAANTYSFRNAYITKIR
jgi:hypothetical protein